MTEDLQIYRSVHKRQEYPFGIICGHCEDDWPCDADVLLDEVERLHGQLVDCQRDKEQLEARLR